MLENQYVVTVVDGYGCYSKGIRGSGMGSELSSDLIDWALYKLMEERHASPANLRANGIKCWVRFRDDVFTVYSNPNLFQRWFQQCKRICGGVWNLSVETVSKESVDFLDLTIKNTGAPRLSYIPYAKPTKVRIFLSRESGHPTHTCLALD